MTTVTITISDKVNQAIEAYQEAYRKATGKRKPTKAYLVGWLLDKAEEASLALLEEKTQALKETINQLKNAEI